jgi:hypothetical protein
MTIWSEVGAIRVAETLRVPAAWCAFTARAKISADDLQSGGPRTASHEPYRSSGGARSPEIARNAIPDNRLILFRPMPTYPFAKTVDRHTSKIPNRALSAPKLPRMECRARQTSEIPTEALVLLCHKFRCLLRAAQHGQRESVVARAATNLRRIVAIEFGTWRSGRNGGSSGLVTFA